PQGAPMDDVAPTLWAVDADGVFTFASGCLFGASRVDPSAAIGRSVSDVYAGHPAVLEHVRRALAGEAFATSIRAEDSTFEVRYAPQKDAAGTTTGVIAAAARQPGS